MIPSKDHPTWKQLVTGERALAFKALSAAMCLSRILRFVQKEGGSPQAVALAVDDLHAFFRKLEGPLAEDLKAIFGEETGHAENDR
jgi:hypothetical protein